MQLLPVLNCIGFVVGQVSVITFLLCDIEKKHDSYVVARKVATVVNAKKTPYHIDDEGRALEPPSIVALFLDYLIPGKEQVKTANKISLTATLFAAIATNY